ncbi:uncharacterized protein LOC106638526 [Copidosoma floridanum]|uniref:uncharacterized protein LOC106638526 n=1 Tax=Copidosoma floridanum TaxID=29053 RepID=UPI0006C996CD|nr:uncharacterized protein LOC106638526 [Copidosoma floridanum]
MEDSYTVHRRRKAAARRREKTPDPATTAHCEDTSSMDESEERRARMERMVEDTERMELRPDEARPRSTSPGAGRTDIPEVGESASSLPKSQEGPSEPPARGASRRTGDSELRRRVGSPAEARTRSTTTAREDESQGEAQSGKRQRPGGSVRQRRREPSDEEEEEESSHGRSSHRRKSPAKKQIIPLSNESLAGDVAKAKRAYAQRHTSDEYEEEEEEEVVVAPRRKRETTARRRKPSVMHSEAEKKEISESLGNQESSSWLRWIPFFGRKPKTDEETRKVGHFDNQVGGGVGSSAAKKEVEEEKKAGTLEFLGSLVAVVAEFREFCRQNPREVGILVELRNLCIAEAIVTVIICGLGGFAFRFTEGAFESFYKCGVKRVKRDFLDTLWNYSHNMKEDDWKSLARRKLYEFEEQLHEAHEAGVQSYTGIKSWSFLNSMMYSLTVISTIGYGHISPSTTTGRALTIVYAIIGIPMFLIVLADFGKLFTRGIKFLWAFVRRLYHNGSCRKVQKTAQVQEMMKGVQLVYDFATFRRPSEVEEMQRQQQQQQQQTTLGIDGSASQRPDSPATSAMSVFQVDDEFNLPISVAITILVLYIICGAAVFNYFEEWTFFESFYFVFISMSTIGFGDFVPKDPIYMMLSIVYMIFGLALTSMCINVVQVMLTDQFKQASQKIGASIGFQVSDEDGSLRPAPPAPVEIADVHLNPSEKVAPTAKQEDDEL